ncbi:MAG: carbohydrate kinase family protein [bacterium]|nr:carbohydrate kinase family protein [bacterium]
MKRDNAPTKVTETGSAKRATTYDVAVTGYIGVDLAPAWLNGLSLPSFGDLFQPGHLVEVGELEITPGGAVANTGLALRRFGRSVYLNGMVGCDLLGDFIINHFQQGGAGGIRKADRGSTAYGLVLAPPGLDRIFLEHAGCNAAFGMEDIDWPAVTQSHIFHFGYPPLIQRLYSDGGVELNAIFRKVREAGTITSLDMSLPDAGSPAGQVDWPAFMKTILPSVDIFTPSIEELLYTMMPQHYSRIMSDCSSKDIPGAIPQEWYSELGDMIVGLGVRVLMVKAGRHGAYLQTGDIRNWAVADKLQLDTDSWSYRRLWVPAVPADPQRFCNASGAGDCAVAGLLNGLLEGLEMEEAATCAMLAGRDSLYGIDALSGLPDWPGMMDELKTVK